MPTKSTDETLRKTGPDEPIFVLRAQDRSAPAVIFMWRVFGFFAGVPAAKRRAAKTVADEMRGWRTRKTPD
jgi:hypothetical protein